MSNVAYQLDESVATIVMDDGKVNVMSLRMLADLNSALDRALHDEAVVVLTGRRRRLFRRVRPGGPHRGRRRCSQNAHRRIRAGRASAVVSHARRRGVQRSCARDGRVPGACGRPSNRRRGRLQDRRERSRHRNDHASFRDRDLPATARPLAFQPRGDQRADLRTDSTPSPLASSTRRRPLPTC